MPKLKSISLKLQNIYPSSYYVSKSRNVPIVIPGDDKAKVITYIGLHENLLQGANNSFPTQSVTNIQASAIMFYCIPAGLLPMYNNDAVKLYQSEEVPIYQYTCNYRTFEGHNHTDNVQILCPAGRDIIAFRASMQSGTTNPDNSAFFATISYLEND